MYDEEERSNKGHIERSKQWLQPGSCRRSAPVGHETPSHGPKGVRGLMWGRHKYDGESIRDVFIAYPQICYHLTCIHAHDEHFKLRALTVPTCASGGVVFIGVQKFIFLLVPLQILNVSSNKMRTRFMNGWVHMYRIIRSNHWNHLSTRNGNLYYIHENKCIFLYLLFLLPSCFLLNRLFLNFLLRLILLRNICFHRVLIYFFVHNYIFFLVYC